MSDDREERVRSMTRIRAHAALKAVDAAMEELSAHNRREERQGRLALVTLVACLCGVVLGVIFF